MMMLLIETSAELCSVALAEDGKVLSLRVSDTPHSHASLTAVFVDEVLRENSVTVRDCSAVAVSSGPGSYTGLRVGSSTAKGLCYGAGIPLIAVPTLEILAHKALASLQQEHNSNGECGSWTVLRPGALDSVRKTPDSDASVLPSFSAVVPLIDARRNEVYTAVFNTNGSQRTQTRSLVLTPESFSDLLSVGPVVFVGDGAEKCRRILSGEAGIGVSDDSVSGSASSVAAGSVVPVTDLESSAAFPSAAQDFLSLSRFIACSPLASDMAALALERFKQGQFENIAYFEPFYLKDFVATTPKHKLW